MLFSPLFAFLFLVVVNASPARYLKLVSSNQHRHGFRDLTNSISVAEVASSTSYTSLIVFNPTSTPAAEQAVSLNAPAVSPSFTLLNPPAEPTLSSGDHSGGAVKAVGGAVESSTSQVGASATTPSAAVVSSGGERSNSLGASLWIAVTLACLIGLLL